jgi:hypothetical protein
MLSNSYTITMQRSVSEITTIHLVSKQVEKPRQSYLYTKQCEAPNVIHKLLPYFRSALNLAAWEYRRVGVEECSVQTIICKALEDKDKD